MISMYSWYPSDVLNIPRCTHGTLQCTHDIPRCTHDIPLMYSWFPPMYSWNPPDVLNIPRCTEHTLYRVNIEPIHILLFSDFVVQITFFLPQCSLMTVFFIDRPVNLKNRSFITAYLLNYDLNQKDDNAVIFNYFSAKVLSRLKQNKKS